MDVIRAWGFTYKTVGFCWAKLNKSTPLLLTERDFFTGLGFWTRANPELCLLATRGHPQRRSRSVRKLIVSPRREHSRKPDEAYERIEALCEGPYLECSRGRVVRAGTAGAIKATGSPTDEFPARRWAANSYPDAADAPGISRRPQQLCGI